MHRRQRRDGGQPDAAPVPRVAGQRDLGRQRQRAVPRRAARDAEDAGGRRRPSSPKWRRPRARTPRSTHGSARCGSEFGDLADIEYRARDVVDRMALAIQAALLLQHAPGVRGRCVLRVAPGRAAATATTARCRAAWIARRSSSAPPPWPDHGSLAAPSASLPTSPEVRFAQPGRGRLLAFTVTKAVRRWSPGEPARSRWLVIALNFGMRWRETCLPHGPS